MSNRSQEIHAASQHWIESSKLHRKIAATRPGLCTFSERRILDGLREVAPRHDVFREIIQHASLPLIEAVFAVHPPARWQNISTRGQRLAFAGAARNPAVMRYLHALGFDLSAAGARMLRAALEADDAAYLRWILEMGFGVGIKANPIIQLVETCGPDCAALFDAWLRTGVKAGTRNRAMTMSLSLGYPKTAIYLCLIGVSARTLPLVTRQAQDSSTAIMRENLFRQLCRWQGSHHARLELVALEPDRLALLGRHRSKGFAGIFSTPEPAVLPAA